LDFNVQDRLGRTVLHCAAAAGMSEAISVLLDKGVDTQLREFNGNLPVHSAIMHRQPAALSVILTKLGSEALTQQDSNGDLPIHLAVRVKSWQCLSVLIEIGSETMLTIGNEENQTPEDVAKL
jgi:nuclear factor of kappa light polypeptide gene enhancer in B-cells 2